MHTEIGAAREFPQARRSPWPIFPIGHRARGRDAALAQEREDRGAHPLAQGEIIGAKDEAEHSVDTASIGIGARLYLQIVSISHVDCEAPSQKFAHLCRRARARLHSQHWPFGGDGEANSWLMCFPWGF